MSDGVRAMLMRGGTSKGVFFLESDLPGSGSARDELLLRIMGSPDPRQIDGIGGALASDMGICGHETPAGLEADQRLRADLEAIRLAVGRPMGLGDVTAGTIPKMTMVSSPQGGGAVSTRTFIPHRCHDAIGVLGAVSVATACLLPDAPAAELSSIPNRRAPVVIEHPTGTFACVFDFDRGGHIVRAGVVRTARKLFDGLVFLREEL
jgi:4-oxalomesaconate tautomerase